MKIVKDVVPNNSANIDRYEVKNPDGTGTGVYAFFGYSPGELAQTPTPVNAALLEDMYGYSNETLDVVDDAVVRTCGNVTETTTVLEDGRIQTVKTDGTKTITVTMTINEDGSISKVVS